MKLRTKHQGSMPMSHYFCTHLFKYSTTQMWLQLDAHNDTSNLHLIHETFFVCASSEGSASGW